MAPDAAALFTRAAAHAAGWTDSAIKHAVERGRWIRVAAGVYTVAREPLATPAQLARAENLRRASAAAQHSIPAVISHAAAAIAWELPTVCDLSRGCLTVPPDATSHAIAGAHVHRAALPASDVRSVAGRRCTSVSRTVCDLAREHGIDAGVAAGDAAWRLGLMTPDDLDAAVDGCAGWPGRAAAAQTARLIDPLAESPLESLSRLRMATCGLPRPELQVEIGDERGNFVARVDFYWPEFGVVGEADGNVKYQDRADLIQERRRQRRLESLGLVVVRWEWSDLARFAAIARQLAAAFRRGIPRGGGRRWSLLQPCP